MELTALPTYLLSQGVLGAAVLYLLWRQRDLEARLDASQNARIEMLEKTVKEVTAGLVASTEASKATIVVQDKAANSAASIATAVTVIGNKIEHFDETLERLDETIQRLDQRGRA
jgi:3'-phosphoadenosine 5'-phosphosulfate sulfotransferase (PAPS reductase)/FAD synthetase